MTAQMHNPWLTSHSCWERVGELLHILCLGGFHILVSFEDDLHSTLSERSANPDTLCDCELHSAAEQRGRPRTHARTQHARAERWTVAPVPSLSPCAPDHSLMPVCLAWFPLSAAFPLSLPQALGTQRAPQESRVEGLAFKWELTLVISGSHLAQP